MRNTRLLLLFFFVIGLGGGVWWFWYFYWNGSSSSPFTAGQKVFLSSPLLATSQRGSASQAESTVKELLVSPPATERPAAEVPYTVEIIAQDLRVPWSLVFTSPDRILVTERPGRVRVIEKSQSPPYQSPSTQSQFLQSSSQFQLTPQPIRVFTEVSNNNEEGLMGMTLDPAYAQNHFIYFCVAYEKNGQLFDKVIRVADTGSSLERDTVILDNIPAAPLHAGCRLRFGPDGKLYASTGDATNKNQAQDKNTLGGKMLRLNADGSIPNDNPFANEKSTNLTNLNNARAIYSFGHRNPQGFDWDPVTGALIATEHGPSGIDGPGGGDEVNWIQPGKNYGWPIVSHERTQAGMESPLLVFTPAIAPASGMFYRGNVFPQFHNHFFFGLLRGEGIMHVAFDPAQTGKILFYEKLSGIDVGRVRDIVEGPDGLIYFTTSNQDGRGSSRAGDDKVYRLRPK